MRRTIILLALIVAASTMAFGQSSNTSANQNNAAARCLRENLSVKAGETDAAMGGVRSVPYTLTNNSSSPCTLKGYPRFEVLNRQGRVVRRAIGKEPLPGDSQQGPPQLIRLEPGKTAWFDVYYNAGGAGYMGKPCPVYPKVRITVPGTRRAFILKSEIQPCPHVDVEVSPIRSGAPQQ